MNTKRNDKNRPKEAWAKLRNDTEILQEKNDASNNQKWTKEKHVITINY